MLVLLSMKIKRWQKLGSIFYLINKAKTYDKKNSR